MYWIIFLATFIITFKKDTPNTVIEAKVKQVEEAGGKVVQKYDSALKGISFEVPDSGISTMSTSLGDEHVAGIEADGEVTTQGKVLLGGA